MKLPKYLSPTSLSTFSDNASEFYLKYLADDRPDREPQNHHMAVGSAFDAYIKSHLYKILFGENHNPKFDFEALFEAQVEPQNRDRARVDGRHCFESYKISGMIADMLTELRGAIGPPSFEFDILGAINGYREGITIDLDVPVFGKPDLKFIHKMGARVVYDWKVNGFYGKRTTSPAPRFYKIRDGWEGLQSRSHNTQHADCFPMQHPGGIKIAFHYLESVDAKWADQLSTYGWLLGENVGSEFICGIDQLACQPWDSMPRIRVAQHRCRISTDYQYTLLARYQNLWKLILDSQPSGESPGWFFRELSHEDSAARCLQLDHSGLNITDGMSEDEKNKIRLMRDL